LKCLGRRRPVLDRGGRSHEMIAADGPNAPIQETVMLKATKHIDIERLPELVRIAEEVRATQEPRLLRKGKEALALVVPVSARPDSPLPPTNQGLVGRGLWLGARLQQEPIGWTDGRDSHRGACSGNCPRRLITAAGYGLSVCRYQCRYPLPHPGQPRPSEKGVRVPAENPSRTMTATTSESVVVDVGPSSRLEDAL